MWGDYDAGAAHDLCDVEYSTALDVGLGEVEFATTQEGDYVASAKVLGEDDFFDAAEDGGGVDEVVGIGACVGVCIRICVGVVIGSSGFLYGFFWVGGGSFLKGAGEAVVSFFPFLFPSLAIVAETAPAIVAAVATEDEAYTGDHDDDGPDIVSYVEVAIDIVEEEHGAECQEDEPGRVAELVFEAGVDAQYDKDDGPGEEPGGEEDAELF